MQTVIQRKNDPFVYLFVMGEWYCYNPYEAPLGSGAMGDVYVGYRCNTNEQIAVKKVKDIYANNFTIRERAKQEASLAFRHPNLVEMIGYCEYAPDHGPIFILSNFVHGENVDVYVKSFNGSPTRVDKVCKVVCMVLDALDYIHSRGVIHRDIKPSNIMVENGNNVRLMDLGIARMNGGNKFSSYGFIGTPEYAAPEQLTQQDPEPFLENLAHDGRLARNHINATTDIYALGITFYELLTGENPMSCNSDTETLTKQMKASLPTNTNIPKKLMRVIWKATEKEQGKRYQTALDFKKAVQEALLPDPSPVEMLFNWISDNFVVVVLGLVTLAIVLMVTLLLLL